MNKRDKIISLAIILATVVILFLILYNGRGYHYKRHPSAEVSLSYTYVHGEQHISLTIVSIDLKDFPSNIPYVDEARLHIQGSNLYLNMPLLSLGTNDSNITFYDQDNDGIISPGDYFLFPVSYHGCRVTFTSKNDYHILFHGDLIPD